MHVMDLGLTGQACMVTGASRGIGRAVARLLAAEGASVLLVARSGDALEEARAEARGSAEALALDITERGAAARVVEECESRFGGLHALVNNAGTTEAKPLDELEDEDWQQQWELHVMAPMRLMRAAAPRMAERGGGRIVNVCSSSGKRPSLTNAAYSVTKAAQLSLSRVFADAHAPDDVLVNAVAPGPVGTGLWMEEGGLADQVAAAKGISRDEAIEAQQGKIPLGRFGTEDEIAGIVAVLCSALASNVTGAAWSVDGGTVPVII
jgi:3-oxoacyl-[acyl-carrier protein] reductase